MESQAAFITAVFADLTAYGPVQGEFSVGVGELFFPTVEDFFAGEFAEFFCGIFGDEFIAVFRQQIP